jgi:uncharacterized repeat protein (TIGR01451 family)
VTKTVDDDAPDERDTIVYTVTVANHGPDDATGVVVNDVLPGGVTLVSADPGQGSFVPGTGDWDVGGLAAGDQVALSLEVRVNQGTAGTKIRNTAGVATLDQTDPDSDDDVDTATVVVGEANGPGGGDGTAGTGFGAVWLIGALLLLSAVGVAALSASRRRRSRGRHAPSSHVRAWDAPR